MLYYVEYLDFCLRVMGGYRRFWDESYMCRIIFLNIYFGYSMRIEDGKEEMLVVYLRGYCFF